MISFSILLPIYKNNKILEIVNCLNSITKQTLLPNEIVIVYDGYVNSGIKSIVNNKLFYFNKKIHEIFLVKLLRISDILIYHSTRLSILSKNISLFFS